MAKFKDKTGREWHVEIDVYLLEKVAKQVDGVRLDRLYADKLAGLIALLEEPVKLVRVIWVLVEEQAAKLGVEPEDFGRALAGDQLEDAAVALQEAAADFCPRRQRKAIRALAAKGNELADHRTAKALAEIAALDVTSFDSATNSPESSGSTPAPEG